VIGQLEEFARHVSQGLQEPDWARDREIVRALVKAVEVGEQEVRSCIGSVHPLLKGPPTSELATLLGRAAAPTGL